MLIDMYKIYYYMIKSPYNQQTIHLCCLSKYKKSALVIQDALSLRVIRDINLS